MASPLAEAHIEAQAHLRDTLARAVVAVWDALPGHDEADVDTFLDTALPLVEAGQRHSVALVDGFWADERQQSPLGVDPAEFVGEASRKASDVREVYRRPFVLLWHGLKVGKLWEEASQEARVRIATMVQTDLLLAQNAAGAKLVELDPEVQSLERVLRGTCELCADAEAQHTATQPIHPGCQCGFAPSPAKPGTVKEPRWPNEALAARSMGNVKGGRRVGEGAGEERWWDDADVAAMDEYVGTSQSFEINAFLRGQKTDQDFDEDFGLNQEVMDDLVADLDRVFEKAGPIGERIKVTRATGMKLKSAGLTRKKTPYTMVDKGFGSTSGRLTRFPTLEKAGKSSKPLGVRMELTLDPRVRAVWGANPAEDELVIERGVRYVVQSIVKEDDMHYLVKCDILPPEGR